MRKINIHNILSLMKNRRCWYPIKRMTRTSNNTIVSNWTEFSYFRIITVQKFPIYENLFNVESTIWEQEHTLDVLSILEFFIVGKYIFDSTAETWLSVIWPQYVVVTLHKILYMDVKCRFLDFLQWNHICKITKKQKNAGLGQGDCFYLHCLWS